MIIKTKVQELIARGLVAADGQTSIHLFIDDQSQATNGYYSLAESVVAELNCGIDNFAARKSYRALFSRPVKVSLRLCDSAKNPLIRASDLLANSIYLRQNKGADIRIANRFFTQISLP